MRKILVILLLLPVFLFSQEKKKYEKTMSFSRFAKELKESAEKGESYTLEDHYITYDSIRDKKYIKYTYSELFSNEIKRIFVGDMQIKGLNFSEKTKVEIKNCRFGKSTQTWNTTITFQDCSFDTLLFNSNDISSISIDESKISSFQYFNVDPFLNGDKVVKELKKRENQNENSGGMVNITNSKITSIYCRGNAIHKQTVGDYPNNFSIYSSKVNSITIEAFANLSLEKNTIGHGSIRNGYIKDENIITTKDLRIVDNVFKIENSLADEIEEIVVYLEKKNKKVVARRKNHQSGIDIDPVEYLFINKNTFLNSEDIPKDKILQRLVAYKEKGGEKVRRIFYKTKIEGGRRSIEFDNVEMTENYITILGHNDTLMIGDGLIYHDSLDFSQKLKFIKEYVKEKKIYLPRKNLGIRLNKGYFGDVYITDNQTPILSMINIKISESFNVFNTLIDSIVIFEKNTFPASNRINIDSNFTSKIGFYHSNKITFGTSTPKDLDSTNTKAYNKNIQNLITTYRKIISILSLKGDDLKTTLVVKLKDIETAKKGLIYHQNPNIENWFNWQGSIFLKWYSDYGMNPFKALAYCFWVMLYFSMFYFIFYNEWDKIDRSFLMKRFNSAMDYFTTEKRIKDFYASKHDKEMNTFTDFKETLNKNKVYMPTMLAALARPIYQISLLRYKLLNFSYKRAEFMAGRRWIDLDKKEKYWIGSLTFLLTLTYIIYLVFTRALNSVVLSINAFSTLGFGQIPVRGFTKYVAIIEGFIGWFLLSIFLVSVLSQMISI